MKRTRSAEPSFDAKDAALLREVRRKKLHALDEDHLADLHRRVRRARAKHVKNYRRAAAERVGKAGGRGAARPANSKARGRAEAFEDALAKVSGRLAVVARQSAHALRQERLAAARRRAGSPRRDAGERGGDEPAPPGRLDDRRPDTPQRRKRNAGVRAAGARRQAQRDSR